MNTKANNQVNRFVELRNLSDEELLTKAKFYGLNTELADKTALIQYVIRQENTPQTWSQPQAFAIRTREDEEAKRFVQLANAKILPQDENGQVMKGRMQKRMFNFTNREGQIYQIECCFVEMKTETAAKLVKSGWLDALDSQRILLEKMKTNVDLFRCSLIRKQDRNKRFYLMMHVEPK